MSTAEGEVTHYTSLSIIVEKEDYVMAQMAANELSMLVDHIEDQVRGSRKGPERVRRGCGGL